MDIKSVVRCGIPFDERKLVTKVNIGEIPLAPADFCRASDAKFFVSCSIDTNDELKVIGRGIDGNIYVSDKDPLSLTDEEIDEYFGRKNADLPDWSEDMLIGEPLIDENSDYVKNRASY